MSRRAHALVLGVCLAAQGCSAAHGYESGTDFVDALERALCARSIRCEAPDDTWSMWCVGGRYFSSQREAADRGHLVLDRAAAERCITQLDTMPCRTDESGVADACFHALVPALPLGASCAPGLMNGCVDGFCAGSSSCEGRCAPSAAIGETCALRPCEAGSYCDRDVDRCVPSSRHRLGQACASSDECGLYYPQPFVPRATVCAEGVCAIAPARALGDSCGDHMGDCESGLYCRTACRAFGRLGESCGPLGPCGPDLHCDDTVCAPRVGPGEACASSDDCGSAAPYCWVPVGTPLGVCSTDPTESPCEARALGTFFTTRDTCPAGLLCFWYRCRQGRAPGEACELETANEPCDVGSRCVDHLCRRVVAIGADCTDATCPNGAACALGRCRPLPRVGEECTDECLSGSCMGGVCTARADGDACGGDPEPSCAGSCDYTLHLCVHGFPEGSPCGPGAPPGPCARGLHCAPDAMDRGTCVATTCST